jgi:hypothetical protein
MIGDRAGDIVFLAFPHKPPSNFQMTGQEGPFKSGRMVSPTEA